MEKDLVRSYLSLLLQFFDTLGVLARELPPMDLFGQSHSIDSHLLPDFTFPVIDVKFQDTLHLPLIPHLSTIPSL